MKEKIHPQWNNNATVFVGGKQVMTVGSTIEEISTEIWSGNHPFYIGKESIVDTDNLVEKYQQRLANASTKVNLNKASKRKKLKDKRQKGSVTVKDMLKNFN